jgi:hypothetical protein
MGWNDGRLENWNGGVLWRIEIESIFAVIPGVALFFLHCSIIPIHYSFAPLRDIY